MARSTTRILIRLSSLGDLVLCTALVKRLQVEFSGEPLYFVTQESFASFVSESFPKPLEVRSLKSGFMGLAGYFYRGMHLARELDRKGTPSDIYEIFDLHGVAKSSSFIKGFQTYCLFHKLALTVRSTPKKSFRRWLSILWGRDLIGKRYVYKSHLHLADICADTRGERLLPNSIETHPELWVAGPSVRDPKKILIAPDAKHWKKRWIANHWQRYLSDLLKLPQNLRITLVGGLDSLPLDVIDDITEEFPGRIDNLLGQTKLKELARLASEHALTICGNSAWLHISEAVGTPVISLAGPIVAGFGFSPWMSESIELSVKLNCRPCSKHGGGMCKKFGDEFHACMKFITPEQVLAATRLRLSK